MFLSWVAALFSIAAVDVVSLAFFDDMDPGLLDHDFNHYIEKYGRSYRAGSEEYDLRHGLYKKAVLEISAHNEANVGWRMAINKFADHTEGELEMMRGYRRMGSRGSPSPISLHLSAREVDEKPKRKQKKTEVMMFEGLPSSVDWRSVLSEASSVIDQGECGSCWAAAVIGSMRAHALLFRNRTLYSTQELVSCVENPRNCGGTGGCDGATAVLGMEYIMRYGLRTEDEMPYAAKDLACPADVTSRRLALASGTSVEQRGPQIGMKSWTHLPANKLEPLMRALYDSGPVAVSIEAGYRWSFYHGGVMHACGKDAIIDHAVLLAGYGEDNSEKYWLIQNSWGPDWGEEGFIRMQRHNDKEEGQYCGWDSNPKEGNGCDGGPSKVYVCGTCGILSENVLPNFQLTPHGLWATKFNRLPEI